MPSVPGSVWVFSMNLICKDLAEDMNWDRTSKPTLGLTITRILMVLLLMAPAASPHAYASTSYTEQGSIVMLPRFGKPVSALILLPFTGGSAERLYTWRYAGILPGLAAELGLVVVVPPGIGSPADYSSTRAWRRTLRNYTDLIGRDADELEARFGIDPRRIVLAGHSMGGDLAWALPQLDPTRFAGALVMGSRSSYRDLAALKLLATQGFRYYMFAGEREEPMRVDGMTRAIEILDLAGVSFTRARAPGGHLPAPPRIFDEALRYLLGGRPTEHTEAALTLDSMKIPPRTEMSQSQVRPIDSSAKGEHRRLPGEYAWTSTLERRPIELRFALQLEAPHN